MMCRNKCITLLLLDSQLIVSSGSGERAVRAEKSIPSAGTLTPPPPPLSSLVLKVEVMLPESLQQYQGEGPPEPIADFTDCRWAQIPDPSIG